VAKGCWRVRIGKNLKVEQAAYRRSRPRWSVTSVLDLVHPMAPQGATRVGGEKSLRHTLLVPFRRLPLWWLAPPPLPRWEACHWILSRPRAPYESSSLATPLRGGTMGTGQGCQPVFLTRRRPGLPVSPRPAGRFYGFIKTGAEGAHHNPRAKGPSNLRTLRTFGPAGPVHLSPLNPEPSEPFEPYVPFHFML
jgi:hypothetical protein